jgi:hypothetical protein
VFADNTAVARLRIAIGIVLLGTALAGCGGSGERDVAKTPGVTPPAAKVVAHPRPVPQAPRCRPGVVQRLGGAQVAYAALVPRRAVVFRSPRQTPFASFGPRNVNGHATVFGVLGKVAGPGCRSTWYRVELPIRPNGATGWVRARQLRVGVVHTRIVVDLSKRRLTLFRDGRPVLRTTTAVGSPSTPTPTGRYYVNQRLIPPDPSGPWGPGAIGISAHSDVLREWTQGGPIAIHGTNEPGSIGQAVSHGCIRLRNRVLEKLFWATDAGTPVIITA